ncbi:MAG: hypothetical protein DMG32_24515 [Acidobacteria bacterium]|nr:MAG: hypothetical protein DMG32_24515 [Acidobacteriota bacterium]
MAGSDRNTVRRIVRLAEEAGVRGDTPWPEEDKLQAIRQRMGRPGTTVAVGEAEERLKPRTDQIRTWLDKDRLLLTKVHELLGREGLVVSYSYSALSERRSLIAGADPPNRLGTRSPST